MRAIHNVLCRKIMKKIEENSGLEVKLYSKMLRLDQEFEEFHKPRLQFRNWNLALAAHIGFN